MELPKEKVFPDGKLNRIWKFPRRRSDAATGGLSEFRYELFEINHLSFWKFMCTQNVIHSCIEHFRDQRCMLVTDRTCSVYEAGNFRIKKIY